MHESISLVNDEDDFCTITCKRMGTCSTSCYTFIYLSERYGHNAPYASELFVMTTLLSGITIPLLSVAAEFLLQLP